MSSERGSYRVDPNNGVLRRHRLPPHKLPAPPRALSLRVARVLGPQALEKRLDRLREARVRTGLRDPGRVAARRGHGEKREDGDAGGLPLVGDVRVKARRGEVAGAFLPVVGIIRSKIYIENPMHMVSG